MRILPENSLGNSHGLSHTGWMKVTYLGHSCLQVSIGGKELIFDPFIRPNPLAAGVDVDGIHADYILISHGHEDHLADAETLARRTGAMILSNYEIVTWYGAKGLNHGHPMNSGGGYDFDFGRVTFVPAIHSSSLPDGSYGGNPGGFVIESKEGNFYFSGDTALTLDMKLIGEKCQLDWAALCMGDNFTIGPKDAAKAAGFVGVRRVLGIHYDTFPPIVIDHPAARQIFQSQGIDLILVPPGTSMDL